MTQSIQPTVERQKRLERHGLRVMRRWRGYSQAGLAKRLGFSQSYLSSVERGVFRPSTRFYGVLAEQLSAFPELLGANEAGGEIDDDQGHARLAAKTRPASLARLYGEAGIVGRLLQVLDQHRVLPALTIQPEPVSAHACIELRSELIRKQLRIADAPLAQIISATESLGVVVVRSKVLPSGIPALLVRAARPMIFLGTGDASSCSERLAIAEQIAHLVVCPNPGTTEHVSPQIIEHFAMAFLLPRDSFGPECNRITQGGRLSWSWISRLKIRWGVSKAVVLKRCHQLGYLSDSQFSTGLTHLKRRGEAIREYEDDQVPREEPTLLKSLVQLMQQSKGLPPAVIARAVGIRTHLFNQLLGVEESYPSSNVVSLSSFRRLNNGDDP